MSNFLCSYKSDKETTSNTLPDSSSKNLSVQSSSRNSESSGAVANCIRGLNKTIEQLSKENAYLRKTIEEFGVKQRSAEKKNKNFGKMKETNQKLEKQILELKETNLELHDRYNRVKDMYNLIVDKQNRVADAEKMRSKVVENEELKKVNRKLREENVGFLAEVEGLKSQVLRQREKIEELQSCKEHVVQENKKSGKFVNEIAEINEELIKFIRTGKSRSSKKPSNVKHKKTLSGRISLAAAINGVNKS